MDSNTHNTQKASHFVCIYSSNPGPLPDLYFDSFSYPAASIVFGDMAIVSLFLLLFFLANPRSCLKRYTLAHILDITSGITDPLFVTQHYDFLEGQNKSS